MCEMTECRCEVVMECRCEGVAECRCEGMAECRCEGGKVGIHVHVSKAVPVNM